MPYTTPSLAQFRARFPVFEDAEDPLIEALLAEAAGQIDTSWREVDYQPAIMYLAAHLLATDNSAEGEEVEVGGSTGGIASESWGSMSVSYDTSAKSATAASSSEWGSTEYGRRFYSLLKKNKPGIVAI
jgi:hypothetical protein